MVSVSVCYILSITQNSKIERIICELSSLYAKSFRTFFRWSGTPVWIFWFENEFLFYLVKKRFFRRFSASGSRPIFQSVSMTKKHEKWQAYEAKMETWKRITCFMTEKMYTSNHLFKIFFRSAARWLSRWKNSHKS